VQTQDDLPNKQWSNYLSELPGPRGIAEAHLAIGVEQ